MSLSVHLRQLGSPQRLLLHDLQLEVPAGHILTLMGPSGSGKSSLLAAIAGTLEATTGGRLRFDGQVLLDAQDLTHTPTARRGIGLLFQDDLLFAHLTVAENLLFAVPPGPRDQRLAAVEQALAEAGLTGLGTRDPATLSGGQRARVALMRALLARPRALLMDEPFSRLDAALRAQFRPFVFGHLRQRRIPALLVTHDVADIAEADRVLAIGTPAANGPAHA